MKAWIITGVISLVLALLLTYIVVTLLRAHAPSFIEIWGTHVGFLIGSASTLFVTYVRRPR